MPTYPSQRLVRQLNRLVKQAYTDEAIYYDEPSGTTGLDDAGQATQPVTGTKIRCNFTDTIRNRQSLEAWNEVADVAAIDAEIRFAEQDLTPSKGGQFQLSKKYRNPAFIDIRFEIIGIRYRGELGYVCALRKVDV